MNENMEARTFGVELEFCGVSRPAAIAIVATTISKNIFAKTDFCGGAYDKYVYQDSKGRNWYIARDSSIRTCSPTHEGDDVATSQCELITPVLSGSKDIELLQEVVRNLKRYGAKVNRSCGLHVHIGAEDFTPKHLRVLANIWHKNEAMFLNAFQVDNEHRNTDYCQPMREAFSRAINTLTGDFTLQEFLASYYLCLPDEVHHQQQVHYNNHRYHALNFHSLGMHGTIEFRLFNSTLHAGKVKTAIQFALAIMELAKSKKRADPTPAQTDNQAYLMHCFINQLKLKGKEFETCRKFLLENLSGNVAWRTSSPSALVAESAVC